MTAVHVKRLGLKDPADYNQASRKLGVNLGHWSPETLEPGCHSLPHPKESVVYILRGNSLRRIRKNAVFGREPAFSRMRLQQNHHRF